MRKIYLSISIFVAVIVCLVSGIKIKAANNYTGTYYNLNFSENALIYTFPDYHSSYDKVFISSYQPRLDINTPIVRNTDNLLFDVTIPEAPIVDAVAYQLIWAWYFEIIEPEPDELRLSIKVYTLPAAFYRSHQFELQIDIWVPIIDPDNLIINIDSDSVLETYINIGFNEEDLKRYLENNGFSEGYSAIGIMLERYYNAGYQSGYDTGYETALNNGGFLVGVFNSIDAFLSINILPGITIGLFFAVPLVLGLIELIAVFWRKD